MLEIILDSSEQVRNILKIRGLFRLLRVFILFRKINSIRMRAELMQKRHVSEGFDIRAPIEIVLEYLSEIKTLMDPRERRIIGNLNYCIKMISMDKLYETELVDFEKFEKDNKSERGKFLKRESKRNSFINKDVVSWYNNFSSG